MLPATDRRRRELRRRVAQQPRRRRPGPFFRTNVIGTQTLLEAARQRRRRPLPSHLDVRGVRRPRARQRRAVHRGRRRTGPGRRTTRQGGRRPRGARVPRDVRACPITITNCANNYGPYQFPEKVIPCSRPRPRRQPLPMYGRRQNRREWIHVDDHCPAIDAVLERGGSARRTTSAPASSRASRRSPTPSSTLLGKPATSSRRSSPTGPATTAGTSSTGRRSDRARLGAARRSVRSGLAETVDWYARNRDWWEPRQRPPPRALGNDFARRAPRTRARHRRRRPARPRRRRRATRGDDVSPPTTPTSTSPIATPSSRRSRPCGPTSSCTPRRGPPSTPASPIPSGRSDQRARGALVRRGVRRGRRPPRARVDRLRLRRHASPPVPRVGRRPNPVGVRRVEARRRAEALASATGHDRAHVVGVRAHGATW